MEGFGNTEGFEIWRDLKYGEIGNAEGFEIWRDLGFEMWRYMADFCLHIRMSFYSH